MNFRQTIPPAQTANADEALTGGLVAAESERQSTLLLISGHYDVHIRYDTILTRVHV